MITIAGKKVDATPLGKISWAVLIFAMGSCTHHDSMPTASTVTERAANSDGKCNPSSLSYDGAVQGIIRTNCLSCHGDGGDASPSLASYSDVIGAQSAALGQIQNGQMPPGVQFTSKMDKQSLITWLQTQAPPETCPGAGSDSESAPTPSPAPSPVVSPTPTAAPVSCNPTDLTYNGAIHTVIQNNCLSCHGEGGTSPNLGNYNSVVAVRTTALGDVQNGHMPPGGQFTSGADKQSLVDWLSMTSPPPGNCTATPSPSASPSPTPAGLPRVDWTVTSSPHTMQPDANGDDMYTETLSSGLDPNKTYYITGFQIYAQEVVQGAPGGRSPLLHHLMVQNSASPNAITGGVLYGVYVPGTPLLTLPSGYGIKLSGNMTLSLSVHLNSLFAPATAAKTIQIVTKYMLADSVNHVAYLPLMLNPTWAAKPTTMEIPADASSVSHSFTLTPFQWVPTQSKTLNLLGVLYHMHNRGTAATTRLIQGSSTTVINQDLKFSYANQYIHPLSAPPLNSSSQINVQCNWNNTAANQPIVNGKPLPVTNVYWGESTLDEMCVCLLLLGE